jgi:hypothetical protein
MVSWEWAHLLVACTDIRVVALREDHLGPALQQLEQNMTTRGGRPLFDFLDLTGMEMENRPFGRDGLWTGVRSIYLVGGLIRPRGALDRDGWFDTFTLGFGHLRIATPGLQQFIYVPVALFFQSVAPLYLALIGGDFYGDRSSAGTHSGSSRISSVNRSPTDATGGDDGLPGNAPIAPVIPEPPVVQDV